MTADAQDAAEQDDSVDPTDPSVYEIDQPLDNDPDGPDIAGWELEQIVDDTPTWIGPDGDRVKVVKQADKYPLFARDEPIKHGSLDRADSIAKAVEWMRSHPVTDDDREADAIEYRLGCDTCAMIFTTTDPDADCPECGKKHPDNLGFVNDADLVERIEAADLPEHIDTSRLDAATAQEVLAEHEADDREARPDDDVLDYDDLGEFQAERIVRQIAEHEGVEGIEAFVADDDFLSLPSAEAVPLAHAVEELGDDRAVEIAADTWECGSCFEPIEQQANVRKGLCQDCRDEIQSWSEEDTDTMTDQTELSDSTDADRAASVDGGDEQDDAAERTIEDLARERSGLRHDLEAVGAGVIARTDNRRFWIHEDALERPLADLPPNVRDQLERGRGLPYMAREIEGVAEFESTRAPAFFRALADQLGAKAYDLAYRPDVADATLAKHADVPVWIVAEGKYYVAAWLAAHGFDNAKIASALDVSESTIKVNLSKFKSGDL